MMMGNRSIGLPIRLEGARIEARGTPILDGLSLTVEPGAPTIVLGPNGSGKTTLLRAIMGLVPLTGGSLTWDGGSRPGERRAIVFQRPVMLRRSAAANVRFALSSIGVPRRDRSPRMAELLAMVGLATVATRPARRLSGGEQQRLALARALARDPAVLCLDEPTASLDPFATKAVEDVVRSIAAAGVKIIMATHDLGQAKRLGGDAVLLHRGRIVESGPVSEFLASPRTDAAKRFIAGDLLV
jgi:tungstate transport system ATP-binding protein